MFYLKQVKFIHIDMFLIILLTLGAFWGFLEAFLFVFLVELKASSSLLGNFLVYHVLFTEFYNQGLNTFNNRYDRFCWSNRWHTFSIRI